MKITLQQSGGLAGRRPPVTLDTAALGDGRSDVEALARTVLAQTFAPGEPHPDGMAYTLTIATDGGTRDVRCMDGTATPEFTRLAARVRMG